jgi:hypothetical protein
VNVDDRWIGEVREGVEVLALRVGTSRIKHGRASSASSAYTGLAIDPLPIIPEKLRLYYKEISADL